MTDRGQLELDIYQPQAPDRNHHIGGRSFYFFDLDDNVFTLPTPLYIFHKEHGHEVAISTQEFATISEKIGKAHPWHDFEIRPCPQSGSFRRFRQHNLKPWDRVRGRRQPIVEDLLKALAGNESDWKGPSWRFFWHAVHNHRPLSIITARGHSPKTIKDTIDILRKRGHLSRKPNYLSIYPVNDVEVRKHLGDPDMKWHTAQCKKEAIRKSVYQAFQSYGYNPGHRFGMSDDDPKNISLIIEAMMELKKEFPANSFYVIDTHGGRTVKQEITAQVSVKTTEVSGPVQLDLLSTF